MSFRTLAIGLLAVLLIGGMIVAPGCGGGGGGGGDGDNGGNGDDPPPANNDPTINSIDAPDSVFPGRVSAITANATDQDDDDLNYAWDASDGTIQGQGKTVNWTAPVDSGNETITVTVTDGEGGEAQDTVTVTVQDVAPPPPPPFDNL
jgi:hypothetical protein